MNSKLKNRLALLLVGARDMMLLMSNKGNVPSAQPIFLCDAMLGSLARWLRFFGYDTLFPGTAPTDSELAEIAREEGRWLLTQDRELAGRGPRTVMLRATGLEDQLVEVFSRLGLRPEATLGKALCSECNGRLEEASKNEVQPAVPPHVLATATRFRRCSDCGRVYWRGSHSEKIVVRMNEVVARLAVDGQQR